MSDIEHDDSRTTDMLASVLSEVMHGGSEDEIAAKTLMCLRAVGYEVVPAAQLEGAVKALEEEGAENERLREALRDA